LAFGGRQIESRINCLASSDEGSESAQPLHSAFPVSHRAGDPDLWGHHFRLQPQAAMLSTIRIPAVVLQLNSVFSGIIPRH